MFRIFLSSYSRSHRASSLDIFRGFGITRKDKEFYANQHYATVTDGLVVFENDPLLSPPGTKYFYSTYGYSLLSASLEGAAHRDFPTLLRTMVFEPLAMTHTHRPQSAS